MNGEVGRIEKRLEEYVVHEHDGGQWFRVQVSYLEGGKIGYVGIMGRGDQITQAADIEKLHSKPLAQLAALRAIENLVRGEGWCQAMKRS